MNSPVLTPESCERGYNNRAAVPDHAEYFKRYAEDSIRARATLRCTLDVRYGPRPKETLDLFPAGAGRGALLFIHGGYWRAFDKSDYSYIAAPFVAAGIDVAVINYDLCPSVDIGTIIDECRNALAWLVNDGAAHGVATHNIVLAGHSAGGHLAAMLHATDWRAAGFDSSVIKGSVAISGVFDLEPLIHTEMNPVLRLDLDRAAAWSPVRLQPTVNAPLLVAVGALETSEFLRQAQLQWEAWPQVRPAGSTGTQLLAGRHHFSAVDCLAEAAHPLHQETLRLFA